MDIANEMQQSAYTIPLLDINRAKILSINQNSTPILTQSNTQKSKKKKNQNDSDLNNKQNSFTTKYEQVLWKNTQNLF